MKLGALIFGVFIVVIGFGWLASGVESLVRRLRRTPGSRFSDAAFGFGGGLLILLLGLLTIRYRGHSPSASANEYVERITFGVIGAGLIASAVVVWTVAVPPSVDAEERSDGTLEEARFEETTADTNSDAGGAAPAAGGEARPAAEGGFGAEDGSDEFVSDVLAEGPAEAVANAFWTAIGPTAAGVLLVALGLFTLSGVIWPGVPETALSGWMVAVDAVELVGYAALTALCAWLVISGLRRQNLEDVSAGAFFLTLWGIGIGIGLYFGLLDGWIAILSWLGGLLS